MKRLFYIALLTIIAQIAHAQKVALVLSGGGAKGIAHAGVIKALEENGIPIDYVVGTSMGGLVGGFYAASYSAKEIEDILLSEDFQDWVYGNIKEEYNYYYAQKEPNASWLRLDLKLDSTFTATFNTQIASDYSVNFALKEKLAQANLRSEGDFDQLMIPYRAVAAEIFTQREIVFRTGDLGDALRSTMAVPFFYRPIRVNGQFMFDGGIYNNFPVNVALEDFEPDIVIGVNVGSKIFTEYPEDDERQLNQSILFMIMDKSDPSEVAKHGVYLEPNLEGITALEFDRAPEILSLGYACAMEAMDSIKSKIDRRVSAEELEHKRQSFRQPFKDLAFHQVRTRGFKPHQENYIKGLFGIPQQDNCYEMEDIRRGYYALVSDDYFKNVYPYIYYSEKEDAFEFLVEGSPDTKVNLELGGALTSRTISQIYGGIDFNSFFSFYTENHLNFYSGRFYQSFNLYSRIHFPTQTPFYLEPAFTFNKWDFFNSEEIFFDGPNTTPVEQFDRKLGVIAGIPVGLKYKVQAELAYVNLSDRFANAEQFLTTDTLDLMNFSALRIGSSLSRNSLNRKQFADRGSRMQAQIDFFSGTENYRPGSTSFLEMNQQQQHQWLRARFVFERYKRLRSSLTWGYMVDMVLSNQPFFSNYQASINMAPVFTPMIDSRTLFLPNYRAFTYLGTGLKGIYHFNKSWQLRLEPYLFKPYRRILLGPEQSPSLSNDYWEVSMAGSANLVYQSAVGPIALSFNYYDDERHRYGVLLHFGYLIFNKRAME